MPFRLTLILVCFCSYFIFYCAESPQHTNIFDPDTENDAPQIVEIKADLIQKITDSKISFGWTESGDNDFYRYQIFRSDQPDVSTYSQRIAEHPYPFWTSVTDTGLQPNKSYYYRVYTEDKGGKITPTDPFQIMTAPKIFYMSRMINEGTIGSNDYYSKMDVVENGDNSYVFLGNVTVSWDLQLFFLTVNANDPSDRGFWTLKNIISGDSDNDDAPDLYEIYYNFDPADPLSRPSELYAISIPIPAQHILVYNDQNTSHVEIYIFFLRTDALIVKINGDLNTNTFAIDTNWQDNGVWRLGFRGVSIAKLSSNQMVISSDNWIRIFTTDGTEQFNFQSDLFVGLITIGQDDSSGTKYIYATNWNGIIYKYDTNGTLLKSWVGFTQNTGHTSLIGMYADKKGNVFISDHGLNTVNRFNSNGAFLSRWYGNNQSFENNFSFGGSIGVAGHVSISGDDRENIFILDQTPYLYRTNIH